MPPLMRKCNVTVTRSIRPGSEHMSGTISGTGALRGRPASRITRPGRALDRLEIV